MFIVVTICLALVVFASAIDSSEIEIISFSATPNDIYTQAVNSKTVDKTDSSVNSISINIYDVVSDGQTSATLTLNFDSKSVVVGMTGTIKRYSSVKGYVGVFDGVATINGEEEQITADVNYLSDEEHFTAITIGCAGDKVPQIEFFGSFTDAISELATLEIKSNEELYVSSQNNNSIITDELLSTTAVDATTRLQSTGTKVSSGYETATISLYHANELRNQGVM